MRILREAIKYIDDLHQQLEEKSESPDAISQIQRALQPGIEVKLEQKRKFDQVAEQKLWESATQQQSLPPDSSQDES